MLNPLVWGVAAGAGLLLFGKKKEASASPLPEKTDGLIAPQTGVMPPDAIKGQNNPESPPGLVPATSKNELKQQGIVAPAASTSAKVTESNMATVATPATAPCSGLRCLLTPAQAAARIVEKAATGGILFY